MTSFIDTHRDRHGVEPICTTLQVAPSTYYASRRRQPSRRALEDQGFKAEICRVHEENLGVYGVDKVWRQLGREGILVGRDRVARLMRGLGLRGVVRGRTTRTTISRQEAPDRPDDLVKRQFQAPAPNRLWVADITYIWTWLGFVYCAFVIDVFSRRIVGWKVSASLSAEVALDALEMALWQRRGTDLAGLIHHSDRGVQYTAIRYTQRLEDAGAVPSVGSKGDSYDNALAETVNGLYKAEVVWREASWRNREAVELATARWVYWWNCSRLHSACGYVPPAEYEAAYRAATPGGAAPVVALVEQMA